MTALVLGAVFIGVLIAIAMDVQKGRDWRERADVEKKLSEAEAIIRRQQQAIEELTTDE